MDLRSAIQASLFLQLFLASLLFSWLVSLCFRLYTEYRKSKEQDGITLGLFLVFGSWGALTAWWVWTVPTVSMRFELATISRLANLLVHDLMFAMTLAAAAYLDYHLFRRK